MNRFPEKSRGQHLAASHVNALGEAISGLESMRASNASHMTSTRSYVLNPEHIEGLVIVTNAKIDDDDTLYSGLYLGKFRSLRSDDNPDEWSNDDTEYILDLRGLSDDYTPQYDLFLMKNEVVNCWYDKVSGQLVPAEVPRIRRGVSVSSIAADSFGLVQVKYGEAETALGTTVPEIYVKNPAGYSTVNAEQTIDIFYDEALSRWVVMDSGSGGGDVKIFRAPLTGIGAAVWDEVEDELTITNAECQEYAWNSEGTKLLPVTRVEIIAEVPTDMPVKYTVANTAFGRVPGSICIPAGFTEDVEVCEGDELPAVPELDPPCAYDTRELTPYFFLGCKLGPHYIHVQALLPTKRVHILQRPQLQEDIYGVRTLQFPLYEVRVPVPIHDGCDPFPFAVCGPAGAAVPCE